MDHEIDDSDTVVTMMHESIPPAWTAFVASPFLRKFPPLPARWLPLALADFAASTCARLCERPAPVGGGGEVCMCAVDG